MIFNIINIDKSVVVRKQLTLAFYQLEIAWMYLEGWSVTDVLEYEQQIKSRGINLISGPATDLVRIANPLPPDRGFGRIYHWTGNSSGGYIAPFVKLSSNSKIAEKKRG